MSYGNFLADLQKVDDLIDPTVHNNNKNNNNNTNSKQQHSGNNANSNPKIVISSSSSTATLNDNVNGNNIGNSCSSLNTNININNNTSHTSTTSTSSNNNHITVDSLDQHQQLISLPETVGGAAIFLENDHHNSLSTTAAESTNFVAIPLSERPPVICISQDHHQQQHNHHHHQHDNYSESLTRSASCLLRLRRCCIKLFSKIMGSNNPSEVDRYEYYDYSELEEFETPARYRPDSLGALSRATRFTEDEIKRIYRGFKAECPTGVVKEDTFKLIYAQFFPQGANPTLYAHYVFNTLDQDHTGIVSFEDFVQGLSILSRGSVEEKLRWTFQLYDINGDGYITREEMTDIVTAIYELMGRLPDELPEEEKIKGKVERIFQKMDINRDGVVTLEEFLEACHNDEAISRSMSVFDSAF